MTHTTGHRRRFLSDLGAGFGSLALTGLLADEAAADGDDVLEEEPPLPTSRAKL